MFFFSLVLFSLPFTAMAGEWQIIGPKALGMGGAGVAVANDATASYWNPAAFGFFSDPGGGDYGRRDWSLQLVDIGVGTKSHEDFAVFLNDLSKFDFTVLGAATIPLDKVSDFIQLLDTLRAFDENPNRALTVIENAGFRTQFGHFGLGGSASLDVTARAIIDLVNIAQTNATTTTFTIADFTDPTNFSCFTCSTTVLNGDTTGLSVFEETALNTHLTATLEWTSAQAIGFINAVDTGLAAAPPGTTIPPDIATQIENVATLANSIATGPTSGGTIENNTSTIQFKGIGIAEFPLTYGLALSDDLAIGGNIKFMKARVYNFAPKLFDTNFDTALNGALDDFVESTNFGVDLAFLYRPGDRLRFGIVGRNLNSPEFDMKVVLPGDPDHLTERPQIRAGLAYKPTRFITLAADLDLTKNGTTVGKGFDSQTLGAGIEFALNKELPWYFRWIIPTIYRGGAYKNLAESDIGLVYTAGIGWDLLLFNFDIAAAISKETTNIDGDEIPEEAKAEFALTMLF